MSADDELSLTAHHEAGHVVARFFGRLPFDTVTVDPEMAARLSGDADALGYVHIAEPSMVDTWIYAVMTGAGPAAEAYAQALADDDGDPESAEFATLLILRDSIETHSEVAEAVELGVEPSMLAWHAALRWPMVQAIAAALLASDTKSLSHADCAATLRPHAPYLFEQIEGAQR